MADGDSIAGDLIGTAGVDNLTMSGNSVITGNVALDDGANNVTMTDSQIDGTFNSGVDADSLTLTGSTIGGTVNVGAGNNTALLSNSTISSFTAGAGNDSLTLSTSVINGAVDLGAGVNNTLTMTNSRINGTFSETSTAPSAMTLNNSTIIGGFLTSGVGDKVINFTRSTLANVTSNGSGIVTFNATSTVFTGFLAITGGANNIITLTDSSIADDITLGVGDDILTLNNTSVANGATGGGGTDNLILSDSGTIASIFTGFDDLTKIGAGTWNINQNLNVGVGGINIDAGNVFVGGGRTLSTAGNVGIDAGTTLTLTGDLLSGGAVIVNGTTTLDGGALTGALVTVAGLLNGNGNVVGNLNINGTGTISTGLNETISLANNLDLANGSTIETVVGTPGSTGLIDVTGTVSDNPSVNVRTVLQAVLQDQDQYTLLTAGGGINAANYTSLSDSFIYQFDFLDSSDANNLIMTVNRTAYDQLNTSITNDLTGMLEQLEAVGIANPTSQELINLENQNQAGFESAVQMINPTILSNLSGIAASMHRSFNTSVHGRMDFVQFGSSGLAGSEADTQTAIGEQASIWADTNYKLGDVDSDGYAWGYDYHMYSLTLGADTFVADWFIGAALSYGSSSADFDGHTGKTDVDGFSLALYGKHAQGDLFWDNVFSVSARSLDTDRKVIMSGNESKISSSSDGMTYSLSSQVGYEFRDAGYFFTPMAGLAYAQSAIDGADESGSSVFAVKMDDQDYDSLQHKLGFRTGKTALTGKENTYLVELRAFWCHEYLDTDRDTSGRFKAGGTDFDIEGVEADADVLVLGMGWKYEFASNQIGFDYDFEVASGSSSHDFTLFWIHHF